MTKTKQLALNGMCIALVLVATFFVNIRLPFAGNGGLIHLGNVPLFLAAIVYGRKTGFLAGAFGMGLFDLLSGWTLWAPFTFVIVGAMGYVVGRVSENSSHNPYITNLVAMFLALMIKIVGYYFAEVILYGNFIAPLGSIAGNVLQVGIAAIIVLPIAQGLKRTIRAI